ncbi:MAG: methionyl-tRNA formyltransferase [Thermoplasmata archaeon]|nr:MAG: methionyl-tRNA formyltransferase [Thermoplasmata archaeon]
MKIIFLGHRDFSVSCLRKILGMEDIEVSLVVIHTHNYCADCMPYLQEMKELCVTNSIPIEQHDKIREMKDKISSLSPDLMISVGYMGILPKEIFSIPKKGTINLHAGLLPKYRGRGPITWALINDEKEIGVTVHFIDEGIDSGDIIYQDKIQITDEDNAKTLYEKATKKSPDILIRALNLLKDKDFKATPQDPQNVIYYPNIPPELGEINWASSSREIFNKIRALTRPYPGAYTYFKGKKIYIWKSSIANRPKFKGHPGHILEISDNGVLVKTGDSIIVIDQIQFEDTEEVIPAKKIIGKKGEVLGR